MRAFRIIITPSILFALSACATTPSGPQHRYPARIESVGVAGGVRDVGVARDLAANRARQGLVRLTQPRAIEFTYEGTAEASSLKIRFQGEAPPASTRFDKRGATWIAFATATRSEAVLSQLDQLPCVQVTQRVAHPDPGKAIPVAESRALRQAIAQALAGKAEGKAVQAEGRITLADAKLTLEPQATVVNMQIAVEVEKWRPLSAQEAQAVQESVFAEHQELEEWPRAAAAKERLLAALEKPAASELAELADLQLKAEQFAQAADNFARARELAPKQLDYLEGELEAVRKIPDPDRQQKLEEELKAAAEAQAG